MILKKNMLAYIYAFFFILFQQSLHTISLERGLFFMYYLLDETQEAYISYMHVFNLQRFERERVYTGNELFNKSMHLSAVNLHDWRPSTISTPKISHVTENGQWLGVNKKGNHTTHIGSFESKLKKKKRNTTSNENNDGEIRLELIKIIIIATTVAMKMTMAKILSGYDNDSTNKQVKS